MTQKENKFRDIIEVFSRVVNAFQQLEAKPHSFGCKHMLHPVEIHLIEAIGIAGHTSVTDLSQRMGVTKGAISQKLSKLLDMKLICKSKKAEDQRNTSITLTSEGKKAFRGHEKFHQDFFQNFAADNKDFTLSELAFFEKALLQMELTITKLKN